MARRASTFGAEIRLWLTCGVLAGLAAAGLTSEGVAEGLARPWEGRRRPWCA